MGVARGGGGDGGAVVGGGGGGGGGWGVGGGGERGGGGGRNRTPLIKFVNTEKDSGKHAPVHSTFQPGLSLACVPYTQQAERWNMAHYP